MNADPPSTMPTRPPRRPATGAAAAAATERSLDIPARPPVPGRSSPPVPPGRLDGRNPGILADLLALARPGQWPKNCLVVPLVLLDTPRWSISSLLHILWATAAFTAASAVTYVVNDIFDRHADRGHPVKRSRPVAARRIPVAAAWLYASVLGCVTALSISLLPLAITWPIVVYVLLGFAYSRVLKHVPLVDVFIVAAGFLLRTGEGYLVTGIPLSSWLPICVMSLCLLFALGKRRHELAEMGARHRRALSGYSLQLVDLLILLASALSITAYLLFMRQEAPLGQYARVDTLVCAPFAVFGIFRYLQVLIVHRGGRDPVRILLRDRPMVANSILLAIVLAAGLLAARYPALAQSVLHKVV